MQKVAIQLLLVLASVNGFLWDKEVEVIKSEWSPVVVVIRHVEYIGRQDNGTLDCSVPGFTNYRWTVINKATMEGFTESFVLGTGSKRIPESQSHLTIGEGGFDLLNDVLAVSCKALIGLNPRMQIIWAITRLHSPMGYPTDPRVCDFGSTSLETNCLWYQWTYKKDCYYDKGMEYTGSVNMAKHNKCKYWHMGTGPHKRSPVIARLMGIFNKGGHDYCRNIPWNPTCYLKKGEDPSCKENVLTQPWCYSDDDPNEGEFKVHYCDVPECSSCMYGNGDGSFKLYPGRKFPVYLGRSIRTTKITNKNRVLCQQGIGWQDNVCRAKLSIRTQEMGAPHVVTKATPHCYVAKPGADINKIKKVPDENLELVECKFKQCTVRQVWFLFFNTYGNPFVVESNFDGIKIKLVRGRKEERIKFAAFGIHLVSGLTIESNDNRVTSYLDNFSLITRRPPEKLSELVVKNVRKEYSGLYQLQYKFAEADPAVDQGTYKVNFKIDVKEPTSFSLEPSVLKVCANGEGKLRVEVRGYFQILEDTIKWKYGLSRMSINTEILPQNTRFELSADAKGLSIKTVTEDLWVSVEGSSYSGKPKAIAHVTLKDQPFLKSVSPTTQYALPGDVVSLIIENDQLQKVTWRFDAMEISSLPDDPNMGFRRVPRGDHIVTSLVISNVREHQYGSYYVQTETDGCKSTIKFDVRHLSEKPDADQKILITNKVKPVDFNRTGLWCTDELDPYAFYFDIDLNDVTTIGALRNEPLTHSNAVEVQYYTIQYSMDRRTWNALILKSNESKIPYTLLGNEIYWLNKSITTRYLRLLPETTETATCMRVTLFGCQGDTLDCDIIPLSLSGSGIKNLGIYLGIGAVLLGLSIAVFIVIRRRSRLSDEENKTRKTKKRRREDNSTRKKPRKREKPSGKKDICKGKGKSNQLGLKNKGKKGRHIDSFDENWNSEVSGTREMEKGIPKRHIKEDGRKPGNKVQERARRAGKGKDKAVKENEKKRKEQKGKENNRHKRNKDTSSRSSSRGKDNRKRKTEERKEKFIPSPSRGRHCSYGSYEYSSTCSSSSSEECKRSKRGRYSDSEYSGN